MAASLLIADRPWLFLPRLAALIGTDEAIILQQLHWILNDVGRTEIEFGADDWNDVFHFIAPRTMRRRLEHLMELNLLCRKTRQGQPSLWWINHLALANLANDPVQVGHTKPGHFGQPDLIIRYIIKKLIYPLDGQDEKEVLETLKRQKPHELIVTWWNAMAQDIGLTVCGHQHPARKDHMDRCMTEGMLDNLAKLEHALRSNPYYSGKNDHNKAADIDWFLKPGKWQQVLGFGAGGNHKTEYTHKEAVEYCQKIGKIKNMPANLFDFQEETKIWTLKDSPKQKKQVA